MRCYVARRSEYGEILVFYSCRFHYHHYRRHACRYIAGHSRSPSSLRDRYRCSVLYSCQSHRHNQTCMWTSDCGSTVNILQHTTKSCSVVNMCVESD